MLRAVRRWRRSFLVLFLVLLLLGLTNFPFQYTEEVLIMRSFEQPPPSSSDVVYGFREAIHVPQQPSPQAPWEWLRPGSSSSSSSSCEPLQLPPLPPPLPAAACKELLRGVNRSAAAAAGYHRSVHKRTLPVAAIGESGIRMVVAVKVPYATPRRRRELETKHC